MPVIDRSPTEPGQNARRTTISLPQALFRQLDQLVAERGFESRSQAIAEMIHHSLIDHHRELGDEIMAGTITLFYEESKPGLLQELAGIQRAHVEEVISSQHVLLEGNHAMEVLLVQGPARMLKGIADKLITCKGVISGRLAVTSSLLPPLHPKPVLRETPQSGSSSA